MRRVLIAAVLAALLATSCGGSGDDESARTDGQPSGLPSLIAYTSPHGPLPTANATPASLPDIYLVTPQGKAAGRVTTTLAWELDPAWSPDGTRIAFARGDHPEMDAGAFTGPGPSSLWVANADGTDAVQLTSPEDATPTFDTDPAWSPDGESIAFLRTSNPIAESDGLYVVPADGGDEEQLASDRAPPIGWSPDSETVAFDASDGISLVPAGGGDIELLAPSVHAPGDWSPDGKTIAGSEGRHLRLVDVDSGDVTDGGGAPAGVRAMEYSPDGRHLAVAADGGLLIVEFDDAGKPAGSVTISAQHVESVSWAPEGDRLAFAAVGGHDDNGLYVVNLGGSGLGALTGGSWDMEAAWRP